ncbi:MAG: hypothetical protein HQK53_11650 [Oligoflexia bacterium]|nr:hypothetical protein [Oligoflexia bacterium]
MSSSHSDDPVSLTAKRRVGPLHQSKSSTEIWEREQSEGDEVAKEILENNPLFKRIPLRQLSIIYMLLLCGQLVFLANEYYNMVRDYLDFGGLESLGIYIIFLVILYGVGVKFYFFLLPRCKRIVHLLLLLILPSGFIELSVETYLDEAISFDTFYCWYVKHKLGVAAFNQGNYKLAVTEFKSSMLDLDVNRKPAYKILYLKSRVKILRMELMFHKDRKQVLANYLAVYKDAKEVGGYGSVFNFEFLILLEGIVNLYTDLQACEIVLPYQELCLSLAIKEIKSEPSMYYSCLYDKLRCDLKMGDESIWDEFPSLWTKINDYYLSLITKKINPKENIVKLLLIIDVLYAKEKTEFALENYLNIIDLLKNWKLIPELQTVYKKLSEIYTKQGQNVKADIYRRYSEMSEEEIINSIQGQGQGQGQ